MEMKQIWGWDVDFGYQVVKEISLSEVEAYREEWLKTLPADYDHCPWESALDFEDWLYQAVMAPA